MNIRILETAKLEIEQSYEFYEKQQLGLGKKFINEFEKSIELIKEFPTGWSLVSKRVRMCRMNNFPFGIIYQIRNKDILIVSVFNYYRKPKNW